MTVVSKAKVAKTVNSNKLAIALHRIQESTENFLREYRRRPEDTDRLASAELDLTETSLIVSGMLDTWFKQQGFPRARSNGAGSA